MKLPDDPQSVPDAIYVKYERVFDPLPILIDKALTVARCT